MSYGAASFQSDDLSRFSTVCLPCFVELHKGIGEGPSGEGPDAVPAFGVPAGVLPLLCGAQQADAALLKSICSNPFHFLRYYLIEKKPSVPGLITLSYQDKDSCHFVSRSL